MIQSLPGIKWDFVSEDLSGVLFFFGHLRSEEVCWFEELSRGIDQNVSTFALYKWTDEGIISFGKNYERSQLRRMFSGCRES